MNSTLFGIKKFATTFLTEKFCEIDESAILGDDPRRHKDWEDFLKELKKHHSDTVSGIIILSYEDPNFSSRNSFALMLVTKCINDILKGVELNKGREIESVVEF